ncbi:hypothetical protein C1645_757702, partial [Glomus cerebriforme]
KTLPSINRTKTASNGEKSSSLVNRTRTASNEDKSSSSFGYYDSDLNRLPGPPLVNFITTTSSFTCHWDSCKKEFENKDELKSHLKYDHNLDPNCSNNVIEIND